MVDEMDKRIISLLKENSRMTYVDMRNKVGLSEGMIRKRIQSLVSSGVIEKFTVELNPSFGLRALVMISVIPNVPTRTISEQVEKLPKMERIYEVTGDYDLVCVFSAPILEGINKSIEEIRKMEGVIKTNTLIVLHTI